MRRRSASPAPAKAPRTRRSPSPPSHAPAAPAPAAPFPLADLPRDLLGVVLSHLPRHFRLHKASLVCWRWRRLVLATERTLKLTPSPIRSWTQLALRVLFPALTELTFRWLPARVDASNCRTGLPTALIALTLKAPVVAPPLPPALTRLSVKCRAPMWLQSLLSTPLTALQVLELLHEPSTLADLSFPALTRLSIASVTPDAQELLLAHSSQLRSLSLGKLYTAEDLLTGLTCPLLTSLECNAHVFAAVVRGGTLATQYPSLTALHLKLNWSPLVPEALCAAAPLLTSLTVSKDAASIAALFVPHCTRLQVLKVADADSLSALPPACYTAVRKLRLPTLQPPPQVWRMLGMCTNLTSLHAMRLSAHKDFFAYRGVQLERLCKLTIQHPAVATLLSVYSKFREFTPSLRKLIIVTSDLTVEELQNFCTAIRGDRLASVRFHYREGDSAEAMHKYAGSLPGKVMLLPLGKYAN